MAAMMKTAHLSAEFVTPELAAQLDGVSGNAAAQTPIPIADANIAASLEAMSRTAHLSAEFITPELAQQLEAATRSAPLPAQRDSDAEKAQKLSKDKERWFPLLWPSMQSSASANSASSSTEQPAVQMQPPLASN